MKPSTSDPQLVHQILANIATAIERRAEVIDRVDDFLVDDVAIDHFVRSKLSTLEKWPP